MFMRALLAGESTRNPGILGWLQRIADGDVPEPYEADLYTLPPNLTDAQKAKLDAALAKGRQAIRDATIQMAKDFAMAIEASRASTFRG
jgi:hypothetical protein